MKLILQKLTIINFKGIKELTIAFNDLQTNIYAANEVGKTTVADAWHWLLTNKNSNDDKDFSIKNTVHTDLNRADHVVSALIYVDGADVEIKKVFREKWTKKKGAELAEFTGHETFYYYNDVPLSQGDYQKKIADILPESALKLITNPLYFNTIKWQDRRNVLLELAGNITNDEIFARITRAENRNAVDSLTLVLNAGKSLVEYRAQIANNKKRIKTDLVAIPPRIDEVKRGIPEPLDYAAIEAEISGKQKEIELIEASINDRNVAYQQASQAMQQKQNELHSLKTKRNDIRYAIQTQLNERYNQGQIARNNITNTISRLKQDIASKENLLSSRTQAKAGLVERTQNLRAYWNNVNESDLKFDAHQFECPTCKRAYEASDIEASKAQMTSNFIDNKNKELDTLTEQGQKLVKETEECDNMIAQLQTAIGTLRIELSKAENELAAFNNLNSAPQLSLDDELANNDEYVQLGANISKIESASTTIKPADVSELNTQKTAIAREIDALKTKLNSKEQIARANKRVQELDSEERKLAQELADLERTEFLLEEFNRSKMDILEDRINGKFQYVTFKLFDRQINGGESETCETLYKGVPFSDVNTAGKIWAGIDIINTLSKHYNVFAPVFLDNRESVSNIPAVNSQVVNLIVSPEDKLLRVA
ncbi:AAA family ATPase [Mucilaginibacter gynuensis]|uniref:AAA family ATPase n=1 Tax=Mucilaginibacter gynuensis TaxID=1302236 RepID=A0ABP8HG26_9SPHI